MLRLLIASTSLMGQGLPVPAPPPGHFYNRPGATIAGRDADLRRCRAISTGPMIETDRALMSPDETAPDLPKPIAPVPDTIEQCMRMRGWTLYALSPREQARWRGLSARAQHRLVETWTGASRPTWGTPARPVT